MNEQQSKEILAANRDLIMDTVIVIPSKRPAPLRTLESYGILHPTIILSDPDIYEQHQEWIRGFGSLGSHIRVLRGERGMAAQEIACYHAARSLGYEYYFRMDDDLLPRTYIGMERGWYPSPEEAMVHARLCAEEMGTSLTGFVNSSIIVWMGEGFNRSYGLVHGGTHLCRATDNPLQFVDPDLPAYLDVYKSAAYRKRDGAVGRVNFIGLEKRVSQRDSVMNKTPERIEIAKRIILEKHGDIVTCDGTRTLDDGRQTIPNWRMVRGKNFVDKAQYYAQRRERR